MDCAPAASTWPLPADLARYGPSRTRPSHELYDRVLRAAEWTHSLRDISSSIFQTNLNDSGERR